MLRRQKKKGPIFNPGAPQVSGQTSFLWRERKRTAQWRAPIQICCQGGKARGEMGHSLQADAGGTVRVDNG